MKFKIFFILLFSSLFLSCSSEDEDPNCTAISFDNALYESTGTSHYKILNAEVIGHCLELEIQASGCSAKNWKMNLVDSEIVKQGTAPERFVKFSLQSDELCETLITKKESFDLRTMRSKGEKIILNLATWDSPLVVEF